MTVTPKLATTLTLMDLGFMYKAKRTGLPALLGLFSVSEHLLILHTLGREVTDAALYTVYCIICAPHWIESLREGRPARQLLSPRVCSSQNMVWADAQHTLAEGGKEQRC